MQDAHAMRPPILTYQRCDFLERRSVNKSPWKTRRRYIWADPRRVGLLNPWSFKTSNLYDYVFAAWISVNIQNYLWTEQSDCSEFKSSLCLIQLTTSKITNSIVSQGTLAILEPVGEHYKEYPFCRPRCLQSFPYNRTSDPNYKQNI